MVTISFFHFPNCYLYFILSFSLSRSASRHRRASVIPRTLWATAWCSHRWRSRAKAFSIVSNMNSSHARWVPSPLSPSQHSFLLNIPVKYDTLKINGGHRYGEAAKSLINATCPRTLLNYPTSGRVKVGVAVIEYTSGSQFKRSPHDICSKFSYKLHLKAQFDSKFVDEPKRQSERMKDWFRPSNLVFCLFSDLL